MKLTLEIDMENAAFDESWQQESARILRDAAYAVENGALDGLIGLRYVRDSNGNAAGRLYVTD